MFFKIINSFLYTLYLSAINFLQKYVYFFIYEKYFFYFFVNLKKIMQLQSKKKLTDGLFRP